MHKLHANLQLRCKRDPGLRHVLQQSTHSLHSNSREARQRVMTVKDRAWECRRETRPFQVKGWARPLEEVEFKLSHEGSMGFDQKQ